MPTETNHLLLRSKHEQDKQWRYELKAGDQVIVSPNRSRRFVSSVDRLTATQIIIGAYRFNKEHGSLVGNHYGSSISRITESAMEQIKAAENRSKFESIASRPKNLTDGEVGAMLAALEKYRAENPTEVKP
jgi:hypothetical protein